MSIMDMDMCDFAHVRFARIASGGRIRVVRECAPPLLVVDTHAQAAEIARWGPLWSDLELWEAIEASEVMP